MAVFKVKQYELIERDQRDKGVEENDHRGRDDRKEPDIEDDKEYDYRSSV